MKFFAIFFPFLVRWPKITASTLKMDVIAALTGAILIVPKGVAYATIAGLPPAYGLYTAMVPVVVAALWGSSWQMVSGPTTALSIVVFSTLSAFAEAGTPDYVKLALTLTFMVGLIQLGLGLLRMGGLVNFVSHSVIVGFTGGAALLIISNQVGSFFGIHVPRGASFFETFAQLYHELAHINPYVVAVSGVTVLAGYVFKRHVSKIPYLIGAIVSGALVAAGLNAVLGVDTTHIKMISAINVGFPPLSTPVFDVGTWHQLAPVAMAVSILALTEAASIARALSSRTGQRVDGNQEFIGQGLGNVLGAFFSSYTSSGSFNASGVNVESGARTPLAAIFMAVLLLVMVYFLGPLAHYLPYATMAGLLVLVAMTLIDVQEIKKTWRVSKREALVLLATFASALIFHLETAIYIGVGLSVLLYLYRTSQPPLELVTPDPNLEVLTFTPLQNRAECPQMEMIRVNGSLFFGSVSHVQQKIHELDELGIRQNNLMLIASGINFMDLSGAEMLAAEAKRLRERGGHLYLYDLKPEPRQMLEQSGCLDEIGRGNVFDAGQQFEPRLLAQLNADTCRHCEAKVFGGCRNLAMPG
jgi:SulP family sulfate permease